MATRKAPAQDTTNVDTQAEQQPTAEPATLPAPQVQQPTPEAQADLDNPGPRGAEATYKPTVYLPYQP